MSQTLTRAAQENRVIVAVFFSPDPCPHPCPWSQLLSQEVVHHPDFLEKIEAETLLYEVQGTDTELQTRYGLTEFPLLLLLDPQGREFARLPYLPLTAAEYGEKIHQLVEDFSSICTALTTGSFEETLWQTLYEKSKQLSATCYREILLHQGVQCEQGVFFHLEQYAAFLKTHKPKHPQLVALKKKILQRQNTVPQDLNFALALLEFQKLASRARAKTQPTNALLPLVRYLAQKKGTQRWRAQWVIGAYLAAHNHTPTALEYLHQAHHTAPGPFQAEITSLINTLNPPSATR